MAFTDDDLAKLKELVKAHYGHSYLCGCTFANSKMEALLSRLEAAEATLDSCRVYTYDDGLVIVEEPDVELFKEWLNACGKQEDKRR